jgi:cation transport protein ChaC
MNGPGWRDIVSIAGAAPSCYPKLDAFCGLFFPPMNLAIDDIPEDLWVFGYGSLMWRPGFPFVEKVPARMTGLHRSLCVYSFVHRGTPEHPGLVLGLDRGGACRGIAFRVTAADRAKTLRYLREREQVTSVYVETLRGVWLTTQPERRVQALTYVVDRGHPQYAGRLSLDERLHHIRQGHGQSGANRDYVLSTVQTLESMGCRDAELHKLAERLKGGHDGHAAAGAHAALVTPARSSSR